MPTRNNRVRAARLAVRAVGLASTVYVSYRAAKNVVALMDDKHSGADIRRDRLLDQDALAPRNGTQKHVLGSRYFVNKQGMYIFWRRWSPVPGPSGPGRGHAVVIVHGFGEHSGRYEHAAAALTAAGFDVLALDHQGHGCSDGDRCHVQSEWDYVDDVIQLTQEVVAPQQKCGYKRKVYLLGHSMGGLIATLTALKAPELYRGVVLSGPAVWSDPKQGMPGSLSLLARHFPKLQMSPIDAGKISRTRAVVSNYETDPLVYHDGMRLGMFAKLESGIEYVAAHISSFRLPVLVQHGGADDIVKVDAADWFANTVASDVKEKIVYQGWLHEIYNECEADCGVEFDAQKGLSTNRALRDAVSWLMDRVSE